MTPRKPKVAILQPRLVRYRLGLFEGLRAECDKRGIALHLVHGQPSPREALKEDTGVLDWAHQMRNRWVTIRGVDLLWQPFPAQHRDYDLIVVVQENRILSNYPILLGRHFRKAKVAYWGHGRNFQSTVPRGLRERWRSWLTTKVDWWFAYNRITCEILTSRGFPGHRVTCLNNAIDNVEFIADLARVTPEVMAGVRAEIGLAEGAPLGLYCGSLYPEKRLDLLVEIAERVHEQMPEFRLVVIGDGPSRAGLLRRLAGKSWARCVGAKTGLEKATYFNLASAILSPGMVGLHVLDAFCAGVPLFTTRNAPHSPEIAYLEHGENGFVLDDDARIFAGAVLGLLRDRRRCAEVVAAGRSAAQVYTLKNMIANFAGGIEACLASEPRRGLFAR
jgi:glycosyltransferase involved in cell wall biosynthesis